MYRRGPDGDEEPCDVAAPDFPRQAAQAAREAVAAALREAGKDRVLREASLRRGELIDTIVDTPRRVGMVPPRRRHARAAAARGAGAGEELVAGQHLKVMVLEGRRRSQDAVVVVSRSHPQLLRLLLEQEVPEVANGQVVIRGIVREAGRRSKVAVEAADPAVDARGACIGPRGVRHQAIIAELGPGAGADRRLVRRHRHLHRQRPGAGHRPAGRPRRGTREPPRSRSHPDQLSLAIGRGGDNARLVARLCGWRIDVVAVGVAVSGALPAAHLRGLPAGPAQGRAGPARPWKRRTGYS